MIPSEFSKIVMQVDHLTDKQNQELQDILSIGKAKKEICKDIVVKIA